MFTLNQGLVSSSHCPARKGAGGAQEAWERTQLGRGHIWRKAGQQLIGLVVINCFFVCISFFLGVCFYLSVTFLFHYSYWLFLLQLLSCSYLNSWVFSLFTLPNSTGRGKGACAMICCQLGLNHNEFPTCSSAAPEGNWKQSDCSDAMIFNVQTTTNIKFNSSYTTGHVFSIFLGGDDACGINCKTPIINRSHTDKSPQPITKILPYISLWYHSWSVLTALSSWITLCQAAQWFLKLSTMFKVKFPKLFKS